MGKKNSSWEFVNLDLSKANVFPYCTPRSCSAASCVLYNRTEQVVGLSEVQFRSVIIPVITKSTTAQWEFDLFITIIITDWIGRHGILLSIKSQKITVSGKTRIAEFWWKEKIFMKDCETRRKLLNVSLKLRLVDQKLQLWMWLAYWSVWEQTVL